MNPVVAIDAQNLQQASRERGVHRTYVMLLWRRNAAGAFRDIPAEQRAMFIEEYARVLTVDRLDIGDDIKRTQRQMLLEELMEKFPVLTQSSVFGLKPRYATPI